MDRLNIADILKDQRAFVAERSWQQFHTPKNLAMALVGEAAELLELFQWLTPAESKRIMSQPARAKAVTHEMADVFYYLLRLADILKIDLEAASREKMELNRAKYPVALSQGRAKKYNELLVAKGLHPRRRLPSKSRSRGRAGTAARRS